MLGPSGWWLTRAYYAKRPSFINSNRRRGNPSSNSSPLSQNDFVILTKDGILLGINSGCHLCSSLRSSISDAVIDDALGSVRQITNAAGTISETYDYDVFGKPLNTSAVGNPVMFTGRWFDSESGNFYYRARYYQPTLGRFLQRDPIGYLDGMNLYAYTKNNPINFADALGLYKHHVIPKQVWRNLDLRPEVRKFLDKLVIEAGKHGWSKAHLEYNQIMQALWQEYFLDKKGGDITEAMIKEFLKKAESNPAIDELLHQIMAKGGVCLPKSFKMGELTSLLLGLGIAIDILTEQKNVY